MLPTEATFAARLKELRESQGLTTYELSKQTGISDSSIRNYEANRNEPSLHNICAFVNFFKCTSDYLLGIKDNSEMGPTAYHCGKKIDGMKRSEQDWTFFLIDAIKDKAESLRKNERSQYNPDFLKELAKS